MAKYVAAIDQGTTSTRCMLFDHSGQPVAVDQKEHEQIFPKPGWVEHDPMEIRGRTPSGAGAALDKAGAAKDDLCALGITTQREPTLLGARLTGRPVYN